jgi:hypothetical protein
MKVSPTSRAAIGWRWWLLLAASFLLPWVGALGAYSALVSWLPGQVKTEHWRLVASAGFLARGAGAVALLLQIPRARLLRFLSSLLVLCGAVWFAFVFQLRSNRGDESLYVGKPQNESLASCG